ncbi:MAG TPA: AAA family ATPase [Solirubrobacteraceae bacterium]|nr:AAA family ATPase [Solirubrobacteraceae bacterium]
MSAAPFVEHVAKAEHNGAGEAPVPFETYSVDDLTRLPPPSWLIPDYIVGRANNMLYGAAGALKSFLALSWSLSIASGLPWGGRPVTQGAVLYIASEGFSGLLRRVDGWCEATGQQRPDAIRFLPEIVNFLDPHDSARAHATLAGMDPPPVLVVVDTLARAAPGADENSAKDMGKLVAEIDRVRAPIGAASLAIHHVGVQGDRERGSSSLRGAADAMHLLKRDGAGLRLQCTKMKDAEPVGPLSLRAVVARDSLAIEVGAADSNLGPNERAILESLSLVHGGDETSTTRLLETCGLSNATYYRARTLLLDGGYIDEQIEGRRHFNYLTERGKQALLSTTTNSSHGTRPIAITDPGTLGPDGESRPGSESQESLL